MIILGGGGGGGAGRMVVASMYPASRKVFKATNCEYKYTSILDNMLLLRTLRYDICKCNVILSIAICVYKTYFE